MDRPCGDSRIPEHGKNVPRAFPESLLSSRSANVTSPPIIYLISSLTREVVLQRQPFEHEGPTGIFFLPSDPFIATPRQSSRNRDACRVYLRCASRSSAVNYEGEVAFVLQAVMNASGKGFDSQTRCTLRRPLRNVTNHWWRNNSILPIKPSSTHLTNLQRGALAEYGHELLGEHVLKRFKKRVLGAELERVEVIPFSTGVGRMSKNAEKALTLYKACCQRISPRRHNCLPFVTC